VRTLDRLDAFLIECILTNEYGASLRYLLGGGFAGDAEASVRIADASPWELLRADVKLGGAAAVSR
jgi:hypothetical protein